MEKARWALISVWDKTGATDFARGLGELGFGVLASGGTAQYLGAAGVAVKRLEEITGFASLLGGRVKTLHPLVHAGILARRDREEDMTQLEERGAVPLDLVAVNLYPFRQTVEAGSALGDALEMIDIGGPALLRAAAKNFPHVLAVSSPDQYRPVLEMLRRRAAGTLPPEEEARFRRELAREAFLATMAYDYAVSRYLAPEDPLAPGGPLVWEGPVASEGEDASWPQELHGGWRLIQPLRYGENPHQRAAFYRPAWGPVWGMAAARKRHGKELSYNNIADADAAWTLAGEFPFSQPVAVVVKHLDPCACALGNDAASAFRRARAADPVSVFGGIVAFNVPVDEQAAVEMSDIFLEVVVAPSFTPEAQWHLSRRENLRLLEVPPAGGWRGWQLRQVSGGLLLQEPDLPSAAGGGARSPAGDDPSSWQVVTVRRPTSREMQDLAFAWKVAKHVRSNAIVLAHEGCTVGIGQGQPNRVDAARLAISRAGPRARGAVLASDAFFPFPDAVEEAVKAGVTAIVQPGGSLRDRESVAACDKAGLAMVFTGIRHFRH